MTRKIGFNRRFGCRGTPILAHAEINRSIDHPRAFREIHAQEKNVAPAAVGQIHAYRRRFAQDGEEAIVDALRKFRAHAQRMVGGMAGAEHPLIAAHGAHTAPHLVGQGLKAEAVIGGGQGAGDGFIGTISGLFGQKDFNRFFKTAIQEMHIAVKGDHALGGHARLGGQLEAVDGIKEEKGAHALV